MLGWSHRCLLLRQSRMLFVSFPLPFIIYSYLIFFPLSFIFYSGGLTSTISLGRPFPTPKPLRDSDTYFPATTLPAVRAVITSNWSLLSGLFTFYGHLHLRKVRIYFLIFSLYIAAWCIEDTKIICLLSGVERVRFQWNICYLVPTLCQAGLEMLGIFQCTKKMGVPRLVMYLSW